MYVCLLVSLVPDQNDCFRNLGGCTNLNWFVYCVKLESMDAHTPFTFSVRVRSLPLYPSV